jgi:hypothetical protein
MRVAVLEALRCPSCGTVRQFSPAHESRIRSGKAELTKCRDCRRPRPKATERERRWWLARFSAEEIREMGRAIWG